MTKARKTKATSTAEAKTKSKAKAVKKPTKSTTRRDSAVDAVSELVSVLACPKSAVNELALSCENVLDQLDVSCGFARFVSIAWAQRPPPYGELDEIAQALVEECERHATVIGGLLDRLAPMAEENEHADHEDLDPMDVLERVAPMLAQTDDAA
jgi:hypothetical protein